MQVRKIIGLISSILVILNYLANSIIDLNLIDNIQFAEFHETTGRLIFRVSMMGFYYALIKYLKPSGYKSEIMILYSLILIEFASFIIKGAPFYYGSLLSIASVVLFIIFGIRILKLKNDIFLNLKDLKLFIFSMFIAFGLVLIAVIYLTLSHHIELMNVAYTIYVIPYVMGFLFFLNAKEKVNEQLIS